MSILIVIELGGFEDQPIGSEELVLLFESTPFVFVRAEAEDLEFDDGCMVYGVR